jgi:hypothetical protein
MKNAVGYFLIVMGVVGVFSQAKANESLSEAYDFELNERTIETTTIKPSKVYVEDERLIIKINDEVKFSVEEAPSSDTLKIALGFKITDDVREAALSSGDSLPEEIDPLKSFNELSPENRQKFMEKRAKILSLIARGLYHSRGVIGLFSLAGDGFTVVKRGVVGLFKFQPKIEPTEKWSFKESNLRRVQAVVKMVDNLLWFQAPLVISNNELGLVVGGGAIGEQGIRMRGKGGSEEFAISIGINKNAQGFVFEVFHGHEVFHDSLMVTSVAGVVLKAGAYARSRDITDFLKVKPGQSFYPPALPGYMSYGPDYIALGGSTSFGWPPVGADVLTYRNDYQHPPLFAVMAGRMVKGFVRIEVGDVKGSAKIVGQRISDAYQAGKNADYKGMSRAVIVRVVDVTKAISDKLRYMGIRSSCGPVFLLPVGVK